MADAVRKFFADAGNNSVRAFYADSNGFHGYVFYEIRERSTTPEGDDSGQYYKLVTACDAQFLSDQAGTEMLRPTQSEVDRLKRQFNNYAWFTGTWRGRMDRVAAIDISELEAESEQG
jgi:hypothetical protein